jgi:hypothetical protein
MLVLGDYQGLELALAGSIPDSSSISEPSHFSSDRSLAAALDLAD